MQLTLNYAALPKGTYFGFNICICSSKQQQPPSLLIIIDYETELTTRHTELYRVGGEIYPLIIDAREGAGG